MTAYEQAPEQELTRLDVPQTEEQLIRKWCKEATAPYYKHITNMRRNIRNNVDTHKLLKAAGFDVPDLNSYTVRYLEVTVKREDLPRLRHLIGTKLLATGHKTVHDAQKRLVWVNLECPARPGVIFRFLTTLPENGHCQIETVTQVPFTESRVICKVNRPND